jgi:protein SCO1/2
MYFCNMSKRVLYYSIFFLVLFIVFYYLMTIIIPGFGKTGLPVLSKVQTFSFLDQNGDRITNNDVEGKVYLAEFFFTTCPGICPKMNSNLRPVYDKYKNERNFLILSHTVNPSADSVGRLKRYADSLGVDASHWIFLTGKKDSLYLAARVSYLLDDPKNNITPLDEQFIHTQYFALVDKKGRVRSIIDGLSKDELKEMQKQIDELLKEN